MKVRWKWYWCRFLLCKVMCSLMELVVVFGIFSCLMCLYWLVGLWYLMLISIWFMMVGLIVGMNLICSVFMNRLCIMICDIVRLVVGRCVMLLFLRCCISFILMLWLVGVGLVLCRC